MEKIKCSIFSVASSFVTATALMLFDFVELCDCSTRLFLARFFPFCRAIFWVHLKLYFDCVLMNKVYGYRIFFHFTPLLALFFPIENSEKIIAVLFLIHSWIFFIVLNAVYRINLVYSIWFYFIYFHFYCCCCSVSFILI